MTERSSFAVLIAFLVSTALPMGSMAQTCPELEGIWPYGLPLAVAAIDGHVVFGNGSALQIAEVSDPAHPVVIGDLVFSGRVNAIAVSGNQAYVGAVGGGLTVVDVQTLQSPAEVAWLDVGVIDVAIEGVHAYVASGSSLYVIDIGDPFSPSVAGTLDLPGANRVTVSGTRAYVAAGAFGVHVVDVSVHSSPALITTYDSSYYARDVALYHGPAATYLVVADEDFGIRIVDATHPEMGFDEVWLKETSRAQVAIADGSRVYVGDYHHGLYMLDLALLPGDPYLERWMGIGGEFGVVDVSATTSHAFVAGLTGDIWVVDVTDTANLSTAGVIGTPAYSLDVAVSGSFAYVADRVDGLRIVDVSDTSAPFEVGHLAMPGYTFAVAQSGDLVFVAAHTAGLRAIDVTEPSAPLEVGFMDTPGETWDVEIVQPYAYVADGSAGLRVIDVSTPSSPVEIGASDTLGIARAVAVSGDTVYLADGERGLRIFDVADRTVPVEVGFFSTEADAAHVNVDDDIAYLGEAEGVVHVLDVSDPTSPVELGIPVSFATDMGGLGVHDGYAYVSTYTTGTVRVVDVLTPHSICSTDSSERLPGLNRGGIDLADGRVYVTLGESGFAIFAACHQVGTDRDGDGFEDWADACPACTSRPEGAPLEYLGVGRWALVDADDEFETVAAGKKPAPAPFTLVETGGCSCEQIVGATDAGDIHLRRGCATSLMEEWIGSLGP